jgi:hypothetical protein
LELALEFRRVLFQTFPCQTRLDFLKASFQRRHVNSPGSHQRQHIIQIFFGTARDLAQRLSALTSIPRKAGQQRVQYKKPSTCRYAQKYDYHYDGNCYKSSSLTFNSCDFGLVCLDVILRFGNFR